MMMMAMMLTRSHLSLLKGEITRANCGLSNRALGGGFLFLVSQYEIGKLQIAVAGGIGMSVNDGSGRGLLRLLAHQVFVDPQTEGMVIGSGQNGAFWARLGLLYFCRHRLLRKCSGSILNSPGGLQEESSG